MHRCIIGIIGVVIIFLFMQAEVFAQVSGLDAVIPSGAQLEKVTDDMAFDTAGSPCYVNGVLFFTNNNFDDLRKSRVYSMTSIGKIIDIITIRENDGMTATLKLNKAGNLYACEMMGHRVIEMDTFGRVLRVVADKYKGKRIDGPNDMVIDRSSGFYFTDSQFIGKETKMQDKPAVYYVKPDGAVRRVVSDVIFPNGIALSPDRKTLYLANTLGKYLLAYNVEADGSLSNARNFAELELSKENIAKKSEMSGADGVAVDSAGNVFVATTQGLGVQVFDKTGKRLGTIPCPAATNNCTFGGKDLKTLYVSAKDGIYKIPVKTGGFVSFR
ncbi:MAG: SMP-30/gluconolactonase/LRE family protein [Candidatus Latescibacter sp.]|nr:SMP-30/gluconolactonase/LRE family protein [Candidatus Latescibacter sp.]